MKLITSPPERGTDGNTQVRESASESNFAAPVFALSLAMLLSSLGTSIANVGLPTFTVVFSASYQQVQWVVLAYILSMTAVIVTAGRLADVAGRKRLLLGGIALFIVASAMCGLHPRLHR